MFKGIKCLLLTASLVMVGSCEKAAEMSTEQKLQNIMEQAVAGGMPGLSAAIADSEGIIWTGVAGKADVVGGELVREDHLFGVGSITKTFVAIVTLQLVEEGRLRVDQTPLEILGADVVGEVPNADVATIAHLLNHTSGIPSWEDDPLWIREGRGAGLDVKKIWKRRETLPYIATTAPIAVPGEKYSYANTNHTLLGLIIEKITGRDVVDEIRERILEPEGLTEIYLEGFQEVPQDKLPRRYHYATPEFTRDAGIHESFTHVPGGLIDASTSNLSVEWTAGGMVATARDLVKYMAAYRAGKFLKPESMAFVQDWFFSEGERAVGHGLFLIDNPAGKILGHSGSVLGFTGSMYWHETEDVAVVMLANVGTMHIGQKLPGAYTVVSKSDFFQHAIELTKSRRKHD